MDEKTCPTCHGTGEIESPGGLFTTAVKSCPRCHGTGRIPAWEE
ncbi:hypothetical protein GF336_00580 [Candidatus Woesearchaeota archaeon]|nr:hypothetical protein [Candidatus Woesearchaeota archaeon]